MLRRLLDVFRGKDDVERIAHKGDPAALSAYLKTRRLLIPRRPRRFLDASSFTQDQLLEMIRIEAEDFARDPFEPWVLDVDGKRRLPAFSSQKRMEAFSKEISRRMDKVFALGHGEVLIEDIVKELDVDFVDLNLFSAESWEVGVK